MRDGQKTYRPGFIVDGSMLWAVLHTGVALRRPQHLQHLEHGIIVFGNRLSHRGIHILCVGSGEEIADGQKILTEKLTLDD